MFWSWARRSSHWAFPLSDMVYNFRAGVFSNIRAGCHLILALTSYFLFYTWQDKFFLNFYRCLSCLWGSSYFLLGISGSLACLRDFLWFCVLVIEFLLRHLPSLASLLDVVLRNQAQEQDVLSQNYADFKLLVNRRTLRWLVLIGFILILIPIYSMQLLWVFVVFNILHSLQVTARDFILQKFGFAGMRLAVIQRRIKLMREQKAATYHNLTLQRRVWDCWVNRCDQCEEMRLYHLTKKAMAHFRWGSG